MLTEQIQLTKAYSRYQDKAKMVIISTQHEQGLVPHTCHSGINPKDEGEKYMSEGGKILDRERNAESYSSLHASGLCGAAASGPPAASQGSDPLGGGIPIGPSSLLDFM